MVAMKKDPASIHTINKTIGLLMASAYVAIGVSVIVKARVWFKISASDALPFGIILIAYGLFRGYRVYRKHFGS